MIEEDDPRYLAFKAHVEKLGYPVFPMSAPLNLVLRILEAALVELRKVEADPAAQQEDIEYFDFESEERDPNYREIICGYDEADDVYTLEGKQLFEDLSFNEFQRYGSLRYFVQIYRKERTIDRLKELGLSEGDTIRIEDYDMVLEE